MADGRSVIDSGAHGMRFDLAILNATIHTMDPHDIVAQAVGVTRNRILLVGSDAMIQAGCSRDTDVIDGRGRVVLPGFVDAHTHFSMMGIRMTGYLDLSDVRSKEELLQVLAASNRVRRADEWIIGTGWDESRWAGDRRFPTRQEIDATVAASPVALERVDGHLYCVNSRAVQLLALDLATRGVEIESGEPTGRLAEDAAACVRRATAPTVGELADAIQAATRYAHTLGVTSVHQMVIETGEFRDNLKAYQRLWRDDGLQIRATLYFSPSYLDDMARLGLSSGLGDDKLRIGGLKLFTDGSIGAETAWVRGGYRRDPDHRGMSLWESDALCEVLKKAQDNDVQLAIHAIGDEALTQVIGCMGTVVQEPPRHSLRHRIEHCEMLTAQQINEMRRMGLVASMQPNFVGAWGLPGGLYAERFGEDRIAMMNPARDVVDGGVALAFGSDCMPFGPLHGIHWAVNAPFPSQRLSPQQAIRAYTLGAAFAAHAEKDVGSIEPGKLADLILLDGDPFAQSQEIKDMSVRLTIFDGRVVHGATDDSQSGQRRSNQ